MIPRIWMGCALGLAAIISFLAGSVYLLGGPYLTAYILLDSGLVLLIAGVAVVMSAVGSNTHKTAQSPVRKHKPDE